MFIDMPPGTGDFPLTAFESIRMDGSIIVTSPRDIVSMIVGKAVRMARMMNTPIVGLVENMAYFKCLDSGEKQQILDIFGKGHVEEMAKQYNLELLAKLPIDPRIAAACDKGTIELFEESWFDDATRKLEEYLNKEK